MENEGKNQRVLAIYDRLIRGETIYKAALAEEYGVTVKSIQRDIDEIRTFLYESKHHGGAEVCYNRTKKGYELTENQDRLNKKEILALAKILLESRAFEKRSSIPSWTSSSAAAPRMPGPLWKTSSGTKPSAMCH